jgi:hypothetical protein
VLCLCILCVACVSAKQIAVLIHAKQESLQNTGLTFVFQYHSRSCTSQEHSLWNFGALCGLRADHRLPSHKLGTNSTTEVSDARGYDLTSVREPFLRIFDNGPKTKNSRRQLWAFLDSSRHQSLNTSHISKAGIFTIWYGNLSTYKLPAHLIPRESFFAGFMGEFIGGEAHGNPSFTRLITAANISQGAAQQTPIESTSMAPSGIVGGLEVFSLGRW